jgi:hypothetical protein
MQDEILGKEEDDDDERIDTTFFEPIIQLDDDKTSEQLRPLARNVMTQLDRLLMGLHYSMKGRMLEDVSGDEQPFDTDDEGLPRRTRSQSRGRKRTRRDSPHKETPHRSTSARMSSRVTDDESLPDVPRTRDQSRASHASQDQEEGSFFKGRLKLRDWSEVMGLASMMGFPSDVVMRTSKRCADLFGEDLEFRTLPEGRVRKKQKADGREYYAYTESESESNSDRDSAPPSPQLLSNSTRNVYPTVNPKANPKPKSKGKASSSRRKPRQTPAIVPSSSPSASPEPSNAPSRPASRPASRPVSENREQGIERESRPARPGVGKGPHRKADILCPFKDCPRKSNGFSRKWNLNQHMKKAHGVTVNDTLNQRGVSGPEDESAIMVD